MSNIGVSDFAYALLIKDDKTGVEYGDFISIPGLNKITVNPESSTASNYGDNATMETATALGDISISLDLVNLPDADRAALTGHTLKDGVMTYNSNDVTPYVAIRFKGKMANGKNRHVKVLKVMFQETKDEYDTQTEKVAFKNPQLEGKASVRTFDHEWKRTLDEFAETVTEAIAAAFDATVEPVVPKP